MSQQTRLVIGALLIVIGGPIALYLCEREIYRRGGSLVVPPPAPYRFDRAKYQVLLLIKHTEDYCFAPPPASQPLFSASSH